MYEFSRESNLVLTILHSVQGQQAQTQGNFSPGQQALIQGLDRGRAQITEVVGHILETGDDAIPDGDGDVSRQLILN